MQHSHLPLTASPQRSNPTLETLFAELEDAHVLFWVDTMRHLAEATGRQQPADWLLALSTAVNPL